MFKIFILFISVIYAGTALDEDAFKSVKELVESHNYPFDEYTVKTEDDYILGVHRIRHGLSNSEQSGKKVVLLMHQFLTSSADFVNMGDRSLAFLLADRNYDVWLGNARGNTHSRSHETLDPDVDKSTFWSFSFEDVGTKDLPAIIDFILKETGEKQIYYIGHGQGCTAFYIMVSNDASYNDKIKMMAALAPVAHMERIPNPLFRILDTLLVDLIPILPIDLPALIELLLDLLAGFVPEGIFEIFTPSETFVRLCDDDTMFVEICAAAMYAIYGIDSDQLERSKVPVIVSNGFAGSSVQQLKDYASYYYTDKFGEKYDLSKVTVPTGIFYGRNDWLVSPVDIDHLVEDLNENVKLVYEVPYKDFNHIDFLFAKDSKKLVYDRLFEFLENEEEIAKVEL